MRAVFRHYGGCRILEVTLSQDHRLSEPRDALRAWTALSTLVVNAFRTDESGSRLDIPLVAIDLVEAAPQAGVFENWLLLGEMCKVDRMTSFVRDRSGKVVFHGLVAPSTRQGLTLVRTLPDAIEMLRNHEASLRAALDLTLRDAPARFGSSRLCLVGCPSSDLGTLPAELGGLGIDVIPVTSIVPGEVVAFCLSVSEGPTAGTRASVEALSGKLISPIAIVLVYCDSVDDDSLRALIDIEERELLMRVLPKETVDELPVLQDVDPTLISKLADLAHAKRTPVHCRLGHNNCPP